MMLHFLTVGDEVSDKMKKPPFNRFSVRNLSAGGKTVWGNPADVGKIVPGAAFDVVLDNNGKDLDTVRPVVDVAKSAGVKQFLFISSAGIYKATVEPPHVEGDAVKADAGHVAVEKYIGETFSSWDSFRIVRNRSVPIPGSGMQLTNISHARDLSSMLIVAVENPTAASGNMFNCVSDRAVTLDGMAKLCAQAAGLPVEIVHYDPKACWKTRTAKELLFWSSSTKLPEDLKERFEEYVQIGKDKKEMKFELDDKIVDALKVPVAV
ncbi:hypothetical protein MKW98_020761 [Papaver atlanticum]|uniref:NAD-dependent epimerase/dehydratase domain-containing protein n=1 Tax=Papaver atlanticum TaxID=357466 RepID=A0AAD4XXI6_9MAGN|nr:hypothetical protein MKW98_020761 [Papaver atlanticum]